MTAEDRAAHVEREAVDAADVRDEAVEATVEWVARCSHPGPNGPPDPPHNPYDAVLATLPQTGDAAAALDDLDARCRRAEKTLHTLGSERPTTRDAARLDGKRQGVALVRSYIGEARAALTAGTDQ